jgi:magnesium chelatase family protein
MREDRVTERSAIVRARVIDARERQHRRQGLVNARLDGPDLHRTCRLYDRRAETLLGRAVEKFQLSARGVTRVLRVSRTIADLAGRDVVALTDVAEALQFRIAG